MENKIWISSREKQVLRLLLCEKKAHEIAKELEIDDKTVATYKRRLLEKTSSKTIIGLYLWNKVNDFVKIHEQEFPEFIIRTSKYKMIEKK